MNTRKLVGLFFKTLLIGGITGLVTSFFVKPAFYTENLNPFNGLELISVIIFFIGLGLVFSAVSQTGFFAYLFIHRFGLNLFRTFWPTVQVLLIAFVVFDLVYFPYTSTEGISILWFILMAAGILGFGWIVAKIKARETHQRAFIPALFFMVVMTSLEWVPGLRTSGFDYAWLMIIPLLACNTYQLLILHKLTNSENSRPSDKNASTKKA
ncbi:KinB-signaling pathway activation protein [Lentibacillus amyloliquefaciens]|uniref:KinB-signaling pathway activation protein n=1 Tax=Lentibacillus amyloliquefaciens TaxID=1472767 RepID=A0A0U4F1H1_9BACI|nr:KinB-signaling pathway activation protein [Lentibacillus amyloliquefaciens]ALX49351.1 KinB-signaling pathway activation protein [Lentibacillus amyloliquefaciens]